MAESGRTSEYLIALLRCAINDLTPPDIPEGVSWLEVFRLSLKHSVSALALYALRECMEKIDADVLEKWQEQYNICLIKGGNQQFECTAICKALEAVGIAHMPLKGSSLCHLLKVPELREMSDLDILVPSEDMEGACRVLCENGYTRGKDNGNHVIFTKLPYLCIELHRNLISERYEFYSIFRDPWQYCTPKDGSLCYEMRREDVYLFLITHAAKHYYYRGTGIRSVIDVYLFLREYGSELDEEYLDSRITVDELRSFREKIEALAEVWFGAGCSASEEVEEMAFYIANSATYGTKEGYHASYIRAKVHEGRSLKCAQISLFLRMAFLPRCEMVPMYPSLERIPVLLPFCWIHRWFRILFRKPGSIGKHYRSVKGITYEKRE